MKRYLVTGGAGFVGSNIAFALKNNFECEVIVLDNLLRRGSELNLKKFNNYGIKYIHGDVRNIQDIMQVGNVDYLFECSAEPSVLAGSNGSPRYVIDTNLNGAINCAEFCRKYNAGMFFLSSSRVYPVRELSSCKYIEKETRFELAEGEQPFGISKTGMSENISLNGHKSFYGASKLAAEHILEEYRITNDFPIILNRCGVIAGPGQFGKIDQGIISFWLASHFFKTPLAYIGYEGSGKQVRDVLHIDDLIELILLQLQNPSVFSKDVFNVGGGNEVSCSLLELTRTCSKLTKNKISISKVKEQRYGDIPIYISDCSRINKLTNWKPKILLGQILEDYYKWFKDNIDVQGLMKEVLIH